MLVNYRVEPATLASLPPKPFRPAVVDGYGVAGICLIRLGESRPAGLPSTLGVTSENAAHRVAVVLEAEGWAIEPLQLDEVRSSFFDNPHRFAVGTAVPDSAFLMAGLDTTWRAQAGVARLARRTGSSLPFRAARPAVIVFGYLGVALVVGVSAALLAVVAGQASDRVRLFLRCLRWGVTTGAATGAVVGAMIPLVGALRSGRWSQLNLLLGFGVIGAVIGALVSLIPTLVGAVFITERQRYPYRSAEHDAQRDVTAVFGVVMGVINVPLFVALLAGGNGWSSIVLSLPFIVAGNACVLLILWRARRSIRRVSSATAAAPPHKGTLGWLQRAQRDIERAARA